MIQCDWNLEFLCGDKCVNFEKNGICYCGDDILDHNNLTDISNNVCCNDGPCKKGRKEDVYCLGTKQEVWLPCHGDQCYQTASWGYNNYLCQDQKYCFLRINSCQGKAQCQDQSDLQICSSEQETMKCGDNVSYDNCDQIEGSKYQNFGCKKQDSKIQELLSQSPKFQIPTVLQVLGIPNKSKFCPNKLAEIPKFGKIPTIY